MITHLQGRTKLLPVLAGVLLGCLAIPAHGDEIHYVPDGAHVVMSANFQDVLKSKAFQEMKNMLKQWASKNPGGKEVDLEKELTNQLGIPCTNIARVSMGLAFPDKSGRDDNVGIITTLKPVTAAAIMAAKKPRPYQKNHSYKEIKIGKFTVHEENWQYEQFSGKEKKLGEVVKGDAFCVVEDTMVLYGTLEMHRFDKDKKGQKSGLQKVLERGQKAELSASLQAGLKNAPFTNSAVVVMDIQGMPVYQRMQMFQGIAMPGLKDLEGNLQTLTVKVNEQGKVKASATLFCKDAASAAAANKITEAGLALLKGKVKDDPKLPPEFQDSIKAAREVLAAVKVSTKGNQTTAEVTVEPATAVKFVMSAFWLVASSAPDVPQAEEPKVKKGEESKIPREQK